MVAFIWRDHEFTVNVGTISYGRAAYAARVAANERMPLYQRVNAMLDVFEATIGSEQVAIAYELEPRLFDDPAVMTSFWQALAQAVVGGPPGEPIAS